MNVIVTGGTKGIGRAIVDLFFDKGANIAVCARNNDDLEALETQLKAKNAQRSIITKSVDVSQSSQIIEFGAHVVDSWGAVDVLINNAGVFLPGEILQESTGALEKMIETNLYSAYHLTRVIAPAMISKEKGHIFNMCSIASQIAYPNGGSYSISKFALLGFSKVLREELKNKGVKVTSILPGATWSNSWKGVDLPQNRLMQASDVANIIWSAYNTLPSAVIEEIVLRPQLGDL